MTNKSAQQSDVNTWSPQQVYDWLKQLSNDPEWLNIDCLVNNNICGKQLLLLNSGDIHHLGLVKVNEVEKIMESIEKLRHNQNNIHYRTLQMAILDISCQARSLYSQLSINHSVIEQSKEQKVSLNTLSSISTIVQTVIEVVEHLNQIGGDKRYRSIKSLLLALSIELTSTAQRDQFVEEPNHILRKSAKTLADYCDRIVQDPVDVSMIELII